MARKGITLEKASAGEGNRIYAIGDVHGCIDELTILLKLIDDELSTTPPEDYRIIFLGDYCDRGPNVRGVIDLLIERQERDERFICLFGNHDEKLLQAHAVMAPNRFVNFLRYGGAATLASYGADAHELVKLKVQSDEAARERVCAITRHVVPASHRTFLQSLPRSIIVGDFLFCHAGIRPDTLIENQDPVDLIWIREPFLSHTAPLEKVVVHGHTRQNRADIRQNRINVDTSCCYGGALTCVVLENRQHRLLQVPALERHWPDH